MAFFEALDLTCALIRLLVVLANFLQLSPGTNSQCQTNWTAALRQVENSLQLDSLVRL